MREILKNPMISLLPGQIAFFLVLSIFPLLMIVGVCLSFFDISLVTVAEFLENTLPTDIAEPVIMFMSGKSFDSSVGISMIIGFLLASNGSHAIIVASNALYGFPSDTLLKRRIKALFLIFMLVFLFAFITIVLAYGNIIALNIRDAVDKEIGDTIYLLFAILKWPIAMILIFFNIKLIYVIAPDWQILSKNTTKGALFTTIAWTISTAIFSYYVTHFSHYDIFYGSLSSVVVLMIWIYFISYILVIGISINVKEYREKEE